MSRFWNDWDEVKKCLDETPTTKEREEIFQRAMKSMGVIRENLKTIQQELFFWPKFKKFLASDNVFKYIVCLIGTVFVFTVDIILFKISSIVDTGPNEFPLNYFIIGSILGFIVFCVVVRLEKEFDPLLLIRSVLVSGVVMLAWPFIIGILSTVFSIYYLSRIIQRL